MAYNTDNSTITPPSKNRVRSVTIFYGDNDYDAVANAGEVLQAPYIRYELAGCEPILDSLGAAINDALGLPTYKDTPGWQTYQTVTDTAALLALLTSLITPAQTNVESIAHTAMTQLKLLQL